MIGRIWQWNRLLFPPWSAVAIFLFGYLSVEALYLYAGFVVNPPGHWWINTMPDFADVAKARWLVIGFAAAFYVAYRVSFHPVYRAEYRTWLANTPWTASKPLPLGPVHLLPQDIAVLAILLLLMHTVGEPPLLLVFGFFFAYQLAMAVTLLITGDRWPAYGLLFGLAIALTLAPTGVLGIVAVALVYPLTYWANHKSLSRFPWEMKESMGTLHNGVTRIVLTIVPEPSQRQRLGFPHAYLSPKVLAPSISLAEGTMVSLLAGLWAHAVLTHCPDAESRAGTSILVCVAPASLVTMIRIIRYCGNYWPPISILGRLATGRFLLPRYDRVFVAPLLAFLVLFTGLSYSLDNRAVGTWDMPLVLAVCLWLNLSLGPSLLEWRLTGGHRLGLGPRSRQFFAEPKERNP